MRQLFFLTLASAQRPWEGGATPVEMRLPPVDESKGNDVNISWYLTSLKDLDEAEERIDIYAMISIRWRDERWVKASDQRWQRLCETGAGCSAADREAAKSWADEVVQSAVFGQSATAFYESTNGFGGDLGLIMAGNVWTPIPPALKLRTSDNPLGKTEFDPVIRMVSTDGEMEALWADQAKTTFELNLAYDHFPFDVQTLDLCLPFDYYSDPHTTKWVKREMPKSGKTLDVVSLSIHWDGESMLSGLASNTFVQELEAKGFFVTSISSIHQEGSVVTSSVCMRIEVVRRITILILRFFWPLTALLFIPFAGFFIPIEMVMPRVATGFISFLSLQVFRTMAYSLIPKPSSSLLWMDVTMFSVTVIMFVSVLENVLAQAMRANVSSSCARFVDNLSKITFPLIGVLILAVLFIMGGLNVQTEWTMTVCLILLTLWLLIFALAIILYIRRLPLNLMNSLVKQMSSADFRYRGALALDRKELALVFRRMDKDGSGELSADEVLESFRCHGMAFQYQEDAAKFESRLRRMFHKTGRGSLDLDGFCLNFAEVFRYRTEHNDKEEEEEVAAV